MDAYPFPRMESPHSHQQIMYQSLPTATAGGCSPELRPTAEQIPLPLGAPYDRPSPKVPRSPFDFQPPWMAQPPTPTSSYHSAAALHHPNQAPPPPGYIPFQPNFGPPVHHPFPDYAQPSPPIMSPPLPGYPAPSMHPMMPKLEPPSPGPQGTFDYGTRYSVPQPPLTPYDTPFGTHRADSLRHMGTSMLSPDLSLVRTGTGTSGSSDADSVARLITPQFEHAPKFAAAAELPVGLGVSVPGSYFPPMTPEVKPLPETVYLGRVHQSHFDKDDTKHAGYTLSESEPNSSPSPSPRASPAPSESSHKAANCKNSVKNKLFDSYQGPFWSSAAVECTAQNQPVGDGGSSAAGPFATSTHHVSQHCTSYADPKEERDAQDGDFFDEDDEYSSPEPPSDDDDEFRPTKRARRRPVVMSTQYVAYHEPQHMDLPLSTFSSRYPAMASLFPLFYYALLDDLGVKDKAVPMIGSLPQTLTPVEKAQALRTLYHKGRRTLAQLDAFTNRCTGKSSGHLQGWPGLDEETRIAIRNVRRKIVERCENYRYTRRNILNKHVGKGQWEPIEEGMVQWHDGDDNPDPAGDLVDVEFRSPRKPRTAPMPSQGGSHQRESEHPHLSSQHQPQPQQAHPAASSTGGMVQTPRALRSMPSRLGTTPRRLRTRFHPHESPESSSLAVPGTSM